MPICFIADNSSENSSPSSNMTACETPSTDSTFSIPVQRSYRAISAMKLRGSAKQASLNALRRERMLFTLRTNFGKHPKLSGYRTNTLASIIPSDEPRASLTSSHSNTRRLTGDDIDEAHVH